MRIVFQVNIAGSEYGESVLIAGVSGVDDRGNDHYLIFQREAEDASEGWGVHFEADGQQNSGYGCIETCRISRGTLCVNLLRQLGDLNGVKGFDAALQIDEDSYAALRDGLARIFSDMPGALTVLSEGHPALHAAQLAIEPERAQRGLIGYPSVGCARPVNLRVMWLVVSRSLPKEDYEERLQRCAEVNAQTLVGRPYPL